MERLKAAGEEAVKRFQPEADATYCNVAVSYIAKQLGYQGFVALLANQIVAKMKSSPDFAEVKAEAAQKLANDGKLVVAGIQDEPHGHVAVVAPGKAITSPKWRGALAPLVYNCGKKNGLMGANYAFGAEPKYWALI